jgi:hypothetical protein
MKSITTISQLGARHSIAKLHVKLLKDASNGLPINHVFYIVDSENKKMLELGEELSIDAQVRTKDDNWFSPFGKKNSPKYGGDFNYDYLLRDCDISDTFLTLHDDSFIYSQNIFKIINDQRSEYDFGGFLDQRAKPAYQDIYLDKIPLGELRIGTWFFWGDHRLYMDRKFSMAEYKHFYRWLINFQFKTTRIKLHNLKIRSWLNGSFDINLRARIEGYSFNVLDNMFKDGFGDLAEHFEKISGFFSKRNMLQYADTPNEIDEWRKYFKGKSGIKYGLIEHDIDFLLSLSDLLEKHNIEDKLLNRNTIQSLLEK